MSVAKAKDNAAVRGRSSKLQVVNGQKCKECEDPNDVSGCSKMSTGVSPFPAASFR